MEDAMELGMNKSHMNRSPYWYIHCDSAKLWLCIKQKIFVQLFDGALGLVISLSLKAT